MFLRIEVLVLWVGHTHRDTDQTFSSNSKRLRSEDENTFPDLHEVLRRTYCKNFSVTLFKFIVNWTSFS